MKLEIGSWESVPQILSTLMKYFPDTKSSYAKLQSCYDLPLQFRKSCILLTPQNSSEPFASFVLILQENNEKQIFFETLNPDWTEFSAAIKECSLINWSSAVVGPVGQRLAPLFESLSENVGIKCRDRCQHCEEFYSYHFPSEISYSANIHLPAEISLCILSENHADIVCQLWPYGSTDLALQELKRNIRRSTSLGLISKVNGDLIAFCVHFDYGAIGALHVNEPYRRKGFAEFLVKTMTSRLINAGVYPKVFISLNNTASINLFKKIGYKKLNGTERWHYLI